MNHEKSSTEKSPAHDCGLTDHDRTIAEWWPLKTVAQTGDGLAHIARAVLTRDLDSRAANAATQALSALTKARENEIEARVIALENLLANLPSK